jgi:arabinogalactan oligomer / maltooligosaccharide transport system permease protein
MSLLTTILLIYGGIVLLMLHQGTVVEFARKKGYDGIVPGIVGLLFPIIGLVIYFYQPKRRNVSNQGLREVFSLKNMIGRILIYAEIALVAIIVIVPVVYIVGLSLSNIQSAIPNSIWPDEPNLKAFEYLFEETKFTLWYWNTLSIALINMIVGTVLITGAAFVFARFSFKGKKAGLLTILVLQAFPSFMGLIAMYVLFWKFGLLGQPRALSILYIGGSIPGNLWLIKGFLTQIPKDLDESAMIDGANKFQIFWKIILPLSVPILTFVAVSMFMGPWMDYMLPGYLLNYYPPDAPIGYDVTNQWTLAVGLFKFINDLEYIHYSAFAAGALLVGIPITVLYMLFQRYLIEGIMAGATKG